MKNKTKLLALMVILLAFVTSCKKDNLSSEGNLATNQQINRDIKMSEEVQTYMNALPLGNEQDFFAKWEKLQKENVSKTSLEVWGTGPDGRVYKWNGSSWNEPNAAARLRLVELCTYEGPVWGLGADARIYKWTGSYWAEPNPNAGLYQISPLSSSTAIGIGSSGNLYYTIDGGYSWYRFTTITGVLSVSAGDIFNLWIVSSNHQLYKHTGGVGYAGVWEYKSSVTMNQVKTMYPSGIWAISTTNKIYKSNDPEGSGLYQPNPNAGLYKISSVSSETAWGIGSSYHIYRTINSGASWTEPNPAARLYHVAIGYQN